MAYTFNGTNQYLRERASTNALVSAWPMTLFCRAKSANLANEQVAAAYIYSNSPYSGLLNVLHGAAVGDPAVFGRFGAGNATSSVSYASGDWVSFAGRSYSNAAFDIDAENVVTAGPSTSTSWQSASDIQIGARLVPSFSLGLAGSVATVALWAVALDDAEIASLVAGFSPRRVRPQSLRWYAPLVRELVVPSRYVSPNSALANVNAATVSDHPRSYGM